MEMLENMPTQSHDVHLHMDTSGSFGCEACWGNHWLQLQWPQGLEEWSIARKKEKVDTNGNSMYGLGPAVVVTESQDSLQQHSGGGGNKIRLLKGTIFDGLITLYILCNCLL